MAEQKSSKRPPLPLVLTGNDLVGGHVVYWTGGGWSDALAEAAVAGDEEQAAALERVLAASGDRIVEPYLAAVAPGPRPIHYREKIRVTGPTFADAGALDVSL